MNIVLYIIIGLQIFLSCCSQFITTPNPIKPDVTHKYELSIVDLGGIPIEGIEVYYILKDSNEIAIENTYTSNSVSPLSLTLNPTSKPALTSTYDLPSQSIIQIEAKDIFRNISTFEYDMKLQDHFYYSGSETINSRSFKNEKYSGRNEVKKINIELSKHNFYLDFKDFDDSPIQNSQVEYEMKCNDDVISQKTVLTDEHGSVSDFVYEYFDKGETSTKSNCYLSYSIENEYYYSNSGIIASSSKWETNISREVFLFKPSDYFEEDFYTRSQNSELSIKLLKVVDHINIHGVDENTILKPRSIKVTLFKEKPFLRFAFTNISYSLMEDKYDTGKNIFDDVIRKLINLNSKTLEESNQFHGYDLSVTNALILDVPVFREIEYRFIIPKDIAKKYANKDITGQKMLDSSVILMDGERIELKLQ
jgi:hypothetical protein